MSALELWRRGQTIVNNALEEARTGREPTRENLQLLDLTAIDLKNQLQLIAAKVSGLDVRTGSRGELASIHGLQALWTYTIIAEAEFAIQKCQLNGILSVRGKKRSQVGKAGIS